MYIDHRQNNWLEQLATVKFALNNKIYITTKMSPFKVNYGREPRMGFKIRKRKKYVKAEEFVKEMKKIYEEAKAILRKLQEKMKKYIDRNRKKTEEYKVRDRILINTKENKTKFKIKSKKIKKTTRKSK